MSLRPQAAAGPSEKMEQERCHPGCAGDPGKVSDPEEPWAHPDVEPVN